MQRITTTLCYSKHSDTKTINDVCDKTMLNELDGIMNATLRERIDKSIVIYRSTCKKYIIFTNELAEELHKPVGKKFERRRVNVNVIDEIWAADLIDMQAFSKQNKGIKYLFTIIDVFSKFVWIVSVK